MKNALHSLCRELMIIKCNPTLLDLLPLLQILYSKSTTLENQTTDCIQRLDFLDVKVSKLSVAVVYIQVGYKTT